VRNAIVAVILLLAASSGQSQEAYQVLRGDSQGFAKVIRGKSLEFPRDHAPHPDFRIEWWYITTNLSDDQGQHWGLQWTLFRQALNPTSRPEGWDSNQIWMAHAAISTPEGHHFEQRFARGGIGQAGVSNISTAGYFEAWLDDWHWRSSSNQVFPSRLNFSVGEIKVDMQLESTADKVLHGDHGYSQKSALGQASYYYSQPAIRVKGTVQIDGKLVTLSGSGWYDREWSSQPLAQNQQGWDWFSLHLDDGNKLMLYRLRNDGNDNWLSGSWINKDGQKRHLSGEEIEMTAISTRAVNVGNNRQIKLPLKWKIKLPALNREWRVKPLYDQQWLSTRFAYWEGVVLVQDADGRPSGVGYMELTGYDK
jgi:predicted secreted hydrolase